MTTTTRTIRYYAEYCPYGVTVLNRNGGQANKLLVFATRRDRDAWVAADPQHREVLHATANKVRAALRFEERLGYSIMTTADEA
jgi:hypothetical protein